MSSGFQHLGNDILIDISQIGTQFVTEELMVNRVVGEFPVPKRKCDEQSRVACKHLVFVGILMQCHSNARIIDMIGHVDHH